MHYKKFYKAISLMSASLLLLTSHPVMASAEPQERQTMQSESETDVREHVKAESIDKKETKETQTSESKVPETKVPETKVPETKVPETKVPETKVPETKVPETTVPESKETETMAPETAESETKESETKAPETVPETKVPETTPETDESETKESETKAPQTDESQTESDNESETNEPESETNESESETKEPEDEKKQPVVNVPVDLGYRFALNLQMDLGRPGIGDGPLAFVFCQWAMFSSDFGWRNLGGTECHMGVDIAAPEGTPILCAGKGTVVVNNYNTARGWEIVIDHGEIMGNRIYTRYQHMVGQSPYVVGSEVKLGQVLGGVGNTGRSFGNHLHFEVLKNGIEYQCHEINPRGEEAESYYAYMRDDKPVEEKAKVNYDIFSLFGLLSGSSDYINARHVVSGEVALPKADPEGISEHLMKISHKLPYDGEAI